MIYSSLSAIIALLVSYFLCKIIIFFSVKSGVLDQPNEFRQHDTPTPYFGGIAIFIALCVGIIAFYFFTKSPINYGLALIICFFSFFFAGLIDDIFKFSSLPKLILIIIAALVPCLLLKTSLLNSAFLFLCLVFFSNAFNLLDNIDGLCATTGIAVLLVATIFTSGIYIFPLIAIAAITGFLILNKPKAGIFMGDTGSLLIGSLCVILTLLDFRNSSFLNAETLKFIPLFWLPIYDTSSVIIVRINAGKSILTGGKDHFSHRLMKRGMSNTTVVVLLFIITLSAGIISHFLTPLFSIALFIFIVASAASFELLTSKK